MAGQCNLGWLPTEDLTPMGHVEDGNVDKLRLCSEKVNINTRVGTAGGANKKKRCVKMVEEKRGFGWLSNILCGC